MSRLTTAIVAPGIAVAVAFAGCGPKPEVPPPTEPPSAEEQALPLDERRDLARTYLEQGRIGDAASHYSRILKEEPLDFEANLNLAVALITMEDAKPDSDRDYTVAKGHLATARDVRPDDARPYFHLGLLAFRAKDYVGAIDALSAATSLDPDNEEAHEALGLALLEAGAIAGARSELVRVLEINPANVAANFELGKIYEGEGKNRDAISHLEAALEANPNLDRATYMLERLYYNEGQYAKAEAMCRHFLRFYPDDVQSLEILGNVYRLQERTAEMLETYGSLTQIAPGNTTYWSPIIHHYTEAKAYEEARDVLEKALQHNPYYAYGNVHYGKVLMHYGDESLRSGQKQEAVHLYSTAREHLEKARIDDRYADAATQLIGQVDSRIGAASGR